MEGPRGSWIRSGCEVWRVPRFADRLPGMAFVIDQVDVLCYLASDVRARNASAGTVVARLSEAPAFYLRETVPERAGEPLALAFWEPGYDLVVRGGTSIQAALAEGAQVYSAGRLRERIFESPGQIFCRNEVVCTAADLRVLGAPNGGRVQEPPPRCRLWREPPEERACWRAQRWGPIEEAETVLASSRAAMENCGKNRACDGPRRDRIIVPDQEQFPSGPPRGLDRGAGPDRGSHAGAVLGRTRRGAGRPGAGVAHRLHLKDAASVPRARRHAVEFASSARVTSVPRPMEIQASCYSSNALSSASRVSE